MGFEQAVQAGRIHSIEEVEEALVQVHDLWWRSPGGGKWPFAGDGPWHLLRRTREDGDYGGDGAEGVSSSEKPRTPLSMAEVARRDEVTGWLELVGDAVGAKLLWLVTADYARGEPSPGWKRIAGVIGWDKTDRALAWRYPRALAAVTCALRGLPIDGVQAKRMASRFALRREN